MRNPVHGMFLLVVLFTGLVAWHCSHAPGSYDEIKAEQPVSISPDYTGIVIPPNIAPLNFIIGESGKRVDVCIESRNGKAIHVSSRTGESRIPLKPWRQLLEKNRGDTLSVRISLLSENKQVRHYKPINNLIAEEDIDPFLVYRRIKHNFIVLGNMGIYQRNLENFDEKTLLDNGRLRNCMKCHCFSKKNPDRMVFHMRGVQSAGMILAEWDG